MFFNVVMLFGPKLPDTHCYLPSSIVAGNAEIVNLERFFLKNPQLGLRDLALKIVSIIKKQKQIVLEDEFRLKETRTGLIRALKKKIPSLSVLLVQVFPKYGYMQIMWLYQQVSLSPGSSSIAQDNSNLKSWFDSSLENIVMSSHYVEEPSHDEGFSSQSLTVPLVVRTHYKLEIPVLLLQVEIGCGDTLDMEQIEQLCFLWNRQYPYGRIIFISISKSGSKGLMHCEKETEELKQVLKNLVAKMPTPLYLMRILPWEMAVGNFLLPPEPGIFAIVQQRYLADLHCKSTCCVFEGSDKWKKALERTGIRHIKVTSALKSPAKVLNGHGFTPTVPSMFGDMVWEKPKEDMLPVLPLYELRDQADNGHISCHLLDGIEEHVFFPDMNMFCRCQEDFCRMVTPVDHPGSNLTRNITARDKIQDSSKHSDVITQSPSDDEKRATVSSGPKRRSGEIPAWMAKREKRSTSLQTSLDMPSLTHSRSDSGHTRSSKTVYIMTEKEVTDMALRILREGGRDDLATKYEGEKPD